MMSASRGGKAPVNTRIGETYHVHRSPLTVAVAVAALTFGVGATATASVTADPENTVVSSEHNIVVQETPQGRQVQSPYHFLGRSANDGEVSPQWLTPSRHTQYPSDGGTWTYGFWNARVRSYYLVDRCHGSSAAFNDSVARSADTAPGKTSVATKWAVNSPTNNDQYWYRTC